MPLPRQIEQTEQTDGYQIRRHDKIEQLRANEDQQARQQRQDRLCGKVKIMKSKSVPDGQKRQSVVQGNSIHTKFDGRTLRVRWLAFSAYCRAECNA